VAREEKRKQSDGLKSLLATVEGQIKDFQTKDVAGGGSQCKFCLAAGLLVQYQAGLAPQQKVQAASVFGELEAALIRLKLLDVASSAARSEVPDESDISVGPDVVDGLPRHLGVDPHRRLS